MSYSRYVPHLVLHSFPTRRSSDLSRLAARGRVVVPDQPLRMQRMSRVGGQGDRRAPLQRSEEHTSELQSRGHLVCRLLLAKKNESIAAFRIACSVPLIWNCTIHYM